MKGARVWTLGLLGAMVVVMVVADAHGFIRPEPHGFRRPALLGGRPRREESSYSLVRQEALNAIKAAYSRAKGLQTLSGRMRDILRGRNTQVAIRQKAAAIDCVELVEDAMQLMLAAEQAILGHNQTIPYSLAADIHTWLSGALTSHATCTDAFEHSLVSTLLHNFQQEAALCYNLICVALGFAPHLYPPLPPLPRFAPHLYPPFPKPNPFLKPPSPPGFAPHLYPPIPRPNPVIKPPPPPGFAPHLYPPTPNPFLKPPPPPGFAPHLYPPAPNPFLKPPPPPASPSPPPSHVVVVSKSGKADGTSQFSSIQSAVDAAPYNSTTKYIIRILAGTYYETVRIPKYKINLMFEGDGIDKTIISGNMSVQEPSVTTFNSATVAIAGDGFQGKALTILNTAGPEKAQAVALRVTADRVAFYNCSFGGYQDTLYPHRGRQYYRNCIINGTVDFICGDATAVFEECKLNARLPLHGQYNTFTAQGRLNASSNTGFSFENCILDGTEQLKLRGNNVKSFLGRPWKRFSRTVFLNSYENSIIDPAGWHPWNSDPISRGVYYAEYRGRGPGYLPQKRVPWSFQIYNFGLASQFLAPGFINGDSWVNDTAFL